jgi:hypothetical protein
MSKVHTRPRIILMHGSRRIAVFDSEDLRITPPVTTQPPSSQRRTKTNAADFQFCPIEQHRQVIVEMFRRHACQHPSIPFDDDGGTYLTADEIYEGAVRDMYLYLYRHGLCAVWSYMWNCWYAPLKWKLWARACHPKIPHIRTSMIVEGFWRGFKHGRLKAFSRPRLDFLTHFILTQTIESINEKMDWMDLGTATSRRIGRSKPLAPWQKDLKKQWKMMSASDEMMRMKKELVIRKSCPKNSKARLRRQELLELARQDTQRPPGTYITSLANWTCSCPSYLVSRFLICKHLVREVNTVFRTRRHGMTFFRSLRRHHETPFYRISGIHANPDAPRPLPPPTTSSHALAVSGPLEGKGMSFLI